MDVARPRVAGASDDRDRLTCAHVGTDSEIEVERLEVRHVIAHAVVTDNG
jgi:hypothetical protein